MSKRWQYLTIEVKPKTWGGFDPKVIQDHLARQGSQGWELVQCVNSGYLYPMMLIFKKEQ